VLLSLSLSSPFVWSFWLYLARSTQLWSSSLCSFTIKRQVAESQGLLHPSQVSLGYFPAWFQSIQLTSTQSASPLAPRSHVFLKYVYSTVSRIFLFPYFDPD
jgi:hypothetical protein